jgi:hypothetical protein
MRLEDVFPWFVCDMCYSRLGIQGTIDTLNAAGDTQAAKDCHGSYAAMLSAWGASLPPDAPSDAALPAVTPLPERQ